MNGRTKLSLKSTTREGIGKAKERFNYGRIKEIAESGEAILKNKKSPYSHMLFAHVNKYQNNINTSSDFYNEVGLIYHNKVTSPEKEIGLLIDLHYMGGEGHGKGENNDFDDKDARDIMALCILYMQKNLFEDEKTESKARIPTSSKLEKTAVNGEKVVAGQGARFNYDTIHALDSGRISIVNVGDKNKDGLPDYALFGPKGELVDIVYSSEHEEENVTQ